jgi:LysR family transcriptional regulator, low CO2-responsive transcriptional regulator
MKKIPGGVTPYQLVALASVASSGSLTAASGLLGRTQPAVSAQLKQLSEAIGTPLLVRHRYGVRLAPAAETLLPYAQACVRALEGAQQVLERTRGLEVGKLRVLASTSIAIYVLPPVLAQFHSAYPGIELQMTRHNADTAFKSLQAGTGDVAVIRGGPPLHAKLGPNFVVLTLMRDETVLAVSRGHKLFHRAKVRVKELDGLEIIEREGESATRALIERIAARAKVALNVKFQTVGVEALKEAVLQGFGAGFLSRLALQREVKAGTLAAVSVDARELSQNITLAYPAVGQCPPSVERFVEILEKSTRSK